MTIDLYKDGSLEREGSRLMPVLVGKQHVAEATQSFIPINQKVKEILMNQKVQGKVNRTLKLSDIQRNGD